MNQESVLSQFEMLLPLAAKWATEQEQRIVGDGVALSKEDLGDARAIGVQNPNRVRLLQVETIPRPSQPELKAACDAIDFLTPATRGLTLGYGIFIRSNCWRTACCSRAGARCAVRKIGRDSSFSAQISF